MTSISEISGLIVKQINHNSNLNADACYEEIKAHLKANYPESEVSIGKVNSAKNVTRSANFQFFTDYSGTVFITNKFFN